MTVTWKWAAAAAIVMTTSAMAATPRELLVQAAFQTTNKDQALALVGQAIAGAEAGLLANPRDKEAFFQNAMGTGYRAKLTRKPADAKAARKMLEQYVTQFPRDPEAQLAIGGWHLDAIAAGFLATTVLGAKKDAGVAGVDRSVALGGDRAFFKGFAAMMHIRLDPKNVALARSLAEQAARGATPTPLDRLAKRDAEALLIPLRAGDGKAAAQLSHKLLPFGRLED
ncbi:hypothetical protein Q4F19_14700 [Sphingomonas sp. BIUV-7]|uniref:Chemotaxis protein n=1 Tax=Sphingomonas natans TaxID=3063330 RepID=A0ABT8YBC4_9SPHN|nr:hypothetical protein [Sphingomonas sp. BIUV-7]MDO6415637.1 hypothetical protein [Sphingomonas sp. BIUV-7]